MKFKVLNIIKKNKKVRTISIVIVGLILITGITTYVVIIEKNKQIAEERANNEVKRANEERVKKEAEVAAEENAKKEEEEKIKQEEETKKAEEEAKQEEIKKQQEEVEQKKAGENMIANKLSDSTDTSNSSTNDTSQISQSFVYNLKIANQTTQILAVVVNGGSSATISLHNKVDGYWSQILNSNGFVGINGITNNKREGDGCTPVGVYGFGTAFGVAANPGCNLSYRQVSNYDYWVDDSSSPYYNQWVSTNDVPISWSSAEQLASHPTAYKYAIAINYNASCVPYAGSAIFLHCSTGHGTAGCVSVPESIMVSILNNVHSDCLIVIANGNNIYSY